LVNGKGTEVVSGAVWVGTGPAASEVTEVAVVGTATKVTVLLGVTGAMDGAEDAVGVACSSAETGQTVVYAITVLVTTEVLLALAGQWTTVWAQEVMVEVTVEYTVEVVIPAGAVMDELPNLPDGILDIDKGAGVVLGPEEEEACSKTPPGVDVTLEAPAPLPEALPDAAPGVEVTLGEPAPLPIDALAVTEAVGEDCTPGFPLMPVEVGAEERRQIVGRAAVN